jgi:transposase
MTKFNADPASLHTAGASVEPAQPTVHVAYMGLGVHKETVAIAVAEPGRQEPGYEGEIANTPKRVERKIQQLSERYGGGLLQFVYEAGP